MNKFSFSPVVVNKVCGVEEDFIVLFYSFVSKFLIESEYRYLPKDYIVGTKEILVNNEKWERENSKKFFLADAKKIENAISIENYLFPEEKVLLYELFKFKSDLLIKFEVIQNWKILLSKQLRKNEFSFFSKERKKLKEEVKNFKEEYVKIDSFSDIEEINYIFPYIVALGLLDDFLLKIKDQNSISSKINYEYYLNYDIISQYINNNYNNTLW